MKARTIIGCIVTTSLLLLAGCIMTQPPIRIESPNKVLIKRPNEIPVAPRLPPIRVYSPRYVPYANQYTLKIINGLAYFVEIDISPDERVYIPPGGQAYVPFMKSRHRRQIPLSGRVLEVIDDTLAKIKGLEGKEKLQRLVGIIDKEIKIPSLKDREKEIGFWRIDRFRPLRK